MHLTLSYRALATCVALASFSSLAHAETTPVETITITGSKLLLKSSQVPAAISVLTQEDIERSGAIGLTELLRGLPGVSLTQSGSPGALTEIRLRGSESNHLLVLIDGVIANDIGQGSLIDLAHLTTAGITRIELLRGPQSALWGSGAIGGVLSITTAGNNAPSLTAAVGVGNQHTNKANINVTTGDKDVFVNMYASRYDTDGDNISRTGTEDDGYRNVTAGGSVKWQVNDVNQVATQFRFTDYRNDYDSTDFVGTGLPADANNVTDGQQITTSVNWLYSPEQSDYSSKLSAQLHQDENNNTTEGSDAGGSTGTRYQVTWENRYQLEKWQLLGGLEYLRREFEQRGPSDFGDPNYRESDNTASIFAEAGAQTVENLFTAFSVRFDNNSQFDNAVSYRAGATWQANADVAVLLSLAKAVKTPTFTELFGYYPGTFTGNPDLQPEKSHEVEIGARYQVSKALFTQLSWFQTSLENEINGFVFDPATGSNTAKNIASDSEREGLEFSLDYQLQDWKVQADYSYLESTYPSGEAQLSELRRPRHSGAVVVSGNLPVEGLTAYAKAAYTGSRLDTFFPPWPQMSQTLTLEPYWLVSVNVGYAIDANWQLSLRVDNVLDESYEDIVGYAGQERRGLVTIAYRM